MHTVSLLTMTMHIRFLTLCDGQRNLKLPFKEVRCEKISSSKGPDNCIISALSSGLSELVCSKDAVICLVVALHSVHSLISARIPDARHTGFELSVGSMNMSVHFWLKARGPPPFLPQITDFISLHFHKRLVLWFPRMFFFSSMRQTLKARSVRVSNSV